MQGSSQPLGAPLLFDGLGHLLGPLHHWVIHRRTTVTHSTPHRETAVQYVSPIACDLREDRDHRVHT